MKNVELKVSKASYVAFAPGCPQNQEYSCGINYRS